MAWRGFYTVPRVVEEGHGPQGEGHVEDLDAGTSQCFTYAYWLAQPYRRGLSDSRPTIRAYRETYATLKDLPGHARAGQFGAVNRVVGAWDVYRRYPFTICGGVLVAAAPFLSKGN